MSRALAGQIALVTGGGAGIGLACVERLAADGATVALIDRDEVGIHAAADRFGEGVLGFVADATDDAAVDRVFASVLNRFDRVDVLVNAAGGYTEDPPIEDLQPQDFEAVVSWNLTSAFLCCRRAVPVMKTAGYGRIVNIASIAGRTAVGGVPLAYTAAKAGVLGLTRGLALQLAASGITVNAVAPGLVGSPRVARLQAHRLDEILADIPMGRAGTAAEVADVVGYLCSPGASYITGATVDVTGGRFIG